MKNIVLIGGSGFLGTHLIDQICAENCINIDKNISKRYPNITTIQDIRDDGLFDVIPENTETIILLAAEHRDDVYPVSLYYDVNVKGTQNVLEIMERKGINNIIFTSSVAVYGLNKDCSNENSSVQPFNHYGKSKWQAEELLRNWYAKDSEKRSLTIIRPTVIFGEGNRGNVFNLLKQIASKRFLMVGSGMNYKSMSYVRNVASFIVYSIENQSKYKIFNYVDKPDMNMQDLIKQVEKSLHIKILRIRIPYFIGMVAGFLFDFVSLVTRKKFTISSIRIKKFCATTLVSSMKIKDTKFIPPFSINEGLDNTLRHEFKNIKNENTL